MKLLLSILLTVAGFSNAYSQGVEMASAMRSEGKIYVVVAVVVLILVGLFLYLLRLEKKVNELEKQKDE